MARFRTLGKRAGSAALFWRILSEFFQTGWNESIERSSRSFYFLKHALCGIMVKYMLGKERGDGMQLAKEKYLTGATIWRRGIWFFMRTLLLILLMAALGYGAFATAMNASNLYILSVEGLQLRAACILQEGDRAALTEYFTAKFLENDPALYSDTYESYTVTGYDYRVEVEKISVLPWSETATVTVVDRMANLAGEWNEQQAEQEAAEEEDAAVTLPKWEEARYLVRFRNEDGRWYIYQMQLLEAAPSLAPKPTPDLRMTPLPMATPTPTPKETATP